VIYDLSGNPHSVELPKNSEGKVVFPVTIKDKDGKVYEINEEIDEDGNTTGKYVVTPTDEDDDINSANDSTANNFDTIQIATAKTYYLIEGNKFYSGDTIFLPLSNKKYEIKAYRDSVNLFGKGSVWSNNVTTVDSATAHFVPNVVSNNISGTTLSTIYNDSIRNDTLQCKIVVVNVEFEEDPSQKWGFDENNPLTENDYPSFKTNPVRGIKWKSLQSNGSSDNIIVKVLPNGAEKSIRFVPSDQGIQATSFIPVSNFKHKLSIKATNTGETDLILQIGYFSSDSLQIKIRSHAQQYARKLAIITIHESNDDMQIIPVGNLASSDTAAVILWGNNHFLDSQVAGDDRIIGDSIIVAGTNRVCETRANNTIQMSTDITSIMTLNELQNYMNNTVYNQANIQWDITILPADTINYDIDKDGKINVTTTFPGPELGLIISKHITNIDYDYFLFLVNNPNDGSLGWMKFGQRFGVIHPNTHTGTNRKHQLQNTIVHELGHGAFSLQHPFNQFSTYGEGGKDPDNFMDYRDGDKIRAYQWRLINP
jgi:hypothetical protein